MTTLNVLISGAGIAGPVLAFFLSQAGHKVTIIERSPTPRLGGQSVDIRGHGISLVRRMGVEAAVRSHITNEKGMMFVDDLNRNKGAFPVGDGKGFTSEVEIMRGHLASVFYDATKDDVEYVFGECVKTIKEDTDGVEVEFENGLPSRRVDVLVGCDGLGSRTRKLAFGSEISNAAINDLGLWSCFYTIPYQPEDDGWARWFLLPLRRSILFRPDNKKISRPSLSCMPEDDRFDKVMKADVNTQKALWTELFSDLTWKKDRLLDGLQQTDEFYMQKVAQIKLPNGWSKGRITLVGDAGYSPSQVTGMGTTLAIVGAYILAGELSKNTDDVPAALQAYQIGMKDFVDRAQKLPPGVPWILHPKSAWGIWLAHLIFGFVSWSGLANLFGGEPPASGMDLPEYIFREEIQS
ncbi:related to salicylate 1-monooxygenase [Ramularia collo-cygni]|uniref:Related to salicylate 1-monooxygenase n=1 Tax=Ramularia collo-cygni TaxID=112498 RepID=A0A2D3UWG7_9PEZI|nr:related to salicylate 1-monooxygenase [Ramularia collo-cygni]CZT22162.1 related to salicylate 1-monooxygenase [Ramularia collo-cygni]